MRTGMTWLVVIACGFATDLAVATDFKDIQLWFSSGWGRPHGFAALGDGTLEILRGDNLTEQHEPCARATPQEIELLSRLVAQIPANAPWGRQWFIPDQCADEAEASLLVTAAKGALDVKYSLQCTPANVPRWVTELVRTMSTLQEKYQTCRAATK